MVRSEVVYGKLDKDKKRRGVVNLKGLPFMFYLIITSPKQPKLRFFQ